MWINTVLLTVAAAAPSTGTGRAAAIESVRNATVLIEVLGPRGWSTGSGFAAGNDSTIATAAHVVKDAWQARIKLPSGEYLPVLGVREYDAKLDLALLAVPPFTMTPVRPGNSDSVRLGQHLLALGHPLGLDITLADGLLSGTPVREGLQMLQVSIPLSPGSSGGPVFTEDGQVVGLVVSGMRGNGAEGINFALPFNHVRARMPGAATHKPLALTDIGSGEVSQTHALAMEGPMTGLPPVNESLTADFHRVEGTEVLTRWKRADGVEYESVLRIGLSRTTAGDTLVERVRETVVRQEGDVGRELHRTLYRTGGDNLFSASVRFHAVPGRAKDYGSELEARDDQYAIADMSGGSRNGRAPRGVLPPSIADVVLAAQDSVGGPLEFLVLEPMTERLVAARFQPLRREVRRVPVAKPGTSCSGKTSVRESELPVIVGTWRVGMEERQVTLLANGPHLMIDDSVKCLRLPGN